MIYRQLTDIIEPAVEALGLEFWGCELIRHGKSSELWVYVESENGVTVDQCAEVSRQVGSVLDVEDPISGTYQLQVSSPGLDRVLFKAEQYKAYIGEKVKVKTRVVLADRRNFTGVLIAADDDQIILRCDQADDIQLLYSQIEKAQVIPDI